MASFNKIALMSNLTRDPQLSYLPSGMAVVEFSLAISRKYCGQDIERICNKANWSAYVTQLIQNMQQSVRTFYDIQKLRFLQYPSGLKTEDINKIRQDDAGVIWLGND
jgi:hypothetical protein